MTSLAKITHAVSELGSGRFFVEGSIDGHQATFHLDTGSVFTSVERTDQTEPYPVTGSRTSTGAAGVPREDELITIGQLLLGERVLSDHQVVRCPAGPEHCNRVGMDALGADRLMFDFPSGRMAFDPDLAPETTGFPLRRLVGGIPGVEASIKEAAVEAAWDTGAELTTVDEQFVERNPDCFDFIQSIEGADSTGTPISFGLYQMKEIRIGDRVFADAHAIAMDFSALRGRFEGLELVVGFNLMRGHTWHFDLQRLKWGSS